MTRRLNPFGALVWKEVLELSRYALPAFLLVSALLYASVVPASSLEGRVDPAEHFGWLTLLSALIAGVMGFSQTARESRPDMWALAVHRPVARSTIFASKVLAGELMLLLAVGVPYAAAMTWIAVPGHRAVPFQIEYVLPGLGDLLIGMVFHAAGLYVGARTNTILMRPLAFVTAFVASFLITASQPFWGALLVAAIAGGLLLLGAWAAFISGDDRASQPWLGKVAEGFILLPVAIVAVWIVSGFLSWTSPGRSLEPTARQPEATVAYDGTIVRVTPKPDDRPNTPEVFATSVTDLEGRPRPDLLAALRTIPLDAGLYRTEQPVRIDTTRFLEGYRNISKHSRRLFPGERGPIWYFEPKHGLISVYDDATRRQTGWIGPDGFSSGLVKPARRYEGELRTLESWRVNPYLMIGGSVYTVDYPRPPVLRFRAPAGEIVTDVVRPGYRWIPGKTIPPAPWNGFVVVGTDRAVHVVDSAWTTQISSPHPQLAALYGVSVWRAPYVADRPTFVWYPPSGDTLNRVLEYRLGRSGPVATHVFKAPVFDRRSYDVGSGSGQSITMSPSSGQPWLIPALGPSAISFVVGFSGPAGRRRIPVSALVLQLAISIACMIAVWLLGRRYAFGSGWLATWMVLALIAGPLALLILWLTTDWPAREKCASCGKPRVVTRERCEHCGAPFPAPEPDGTEVFA